jgi:predicted negative regulator of RcsB-dependent stress response
MDEEITIINAKNRNEKIKNFFIENKKLLISIAVVSILILISFYSHQIYKEGQRKTLADKYNRALIEYENGEKSKIILSMQEIIEDRDSTYSPLGLYFLIDNNLITNEVQANKLFDILINEVNLEKEIKNLIIYKKALYNSNFTNENDLILMLNPIINSESIWKSHALFLIGEYFYTNNQKQKAKEFFNKIQILTNANEDIKLESKKRLNRDLRE